MRGQGKYFTFGFVSALVAINLANLKPSSGPCMDSDEGRGDDLAFHRENNISLHEDIFLQAARSFQPITDKVTDHRYEIMYGQFLMPFYNRKPNMKILEIGLGCDMNYGPGASVKLWKHLFPKADLWEAELNSACVEKSQLDGSLEGINVLVGNQGNTTVLDEWISKSGGGDFDVIIDDGGHQQCQIWTTYKKLWPRVQPGGLYFIEDLQVSRHVSYNRDSSELCKKGTNVVDELLGMTDSMLHRKMDNSDLKFIFCQRDACVLGKKE